MVPSHLHTAMTQLGRMLWLPVALQLLNIAFYTPNCAQHNPHQPQNLTWVVLDTHADILNSTSSIAVPGSWFPDLYFDFGTMMDTTISHKWIKRWPLYVCPGHKKDTAHRKKCGGESTYFCADWNCVSTGEITWDPPLKGDFIMLKRTGENVQCKRNQRGVYMNCNPVKISFTTQEPPRKPSLGHRHSHLSLGILLLLACTFGPCILSRLTNFVQTKISTLENMILERHHYQPVQSGEDLEEASLRTLDFDDKLEIVNSIQLRRSMLTLDEMESKDLIPQEDISLHEKTKTEEMLE